MIPYIQYQHNNTTILNWKSILEGNDFECFGAFAYVTDSGVAQVERELGTVIRNGRLCRWVFGIDYGRSQPTALRRVAELASNEVRVFDGAYVVNADVFTPRSIYHLKTAVTLASDGTPKKQFVGSGNLSASGLTSGIEAGCVIDFEYVEDENLVSIRDTLQEIWDNSSPLGTIIDAYEQRYSQIFTPVPREPSVNTSSVRELFWIDVGYVTQNRGYSRPGNQFDLPRGSHKFLGLPEQLAPDLNSLLGELKILTPTGEVIARNLRFGNNSMEKLTLPIPEDHGFGSYDGKILTFEKRDDTVELSCYEPEDFIRSFGRQITWVNEMQSGRRYGTAFIQTQ